MYWVQIGKGLPLQRFCFLVPIMIWLMLTEPADELLPVPEDTVKSLQHASSQ